MGKSSKLKQRDAEAKEAEFRLRFSQLSRQAALVPEEAPLIHEFQQYSRHFVRTPDSFSLRTRSSHRSKQALEMARHLFSRFRVPRVLEQVWEAYVGQSEQTRELPRQAAPRYQRARAPLARAPANPNLRQVDFRAWFVCVGTGGSLYKDHTKGLLTKKETHAFLGASPDLDLCQAVIYAIARCAGAADGAALRLARSKLAEKPFGEFWFDAVRFFCLPDHLPASVAQVNDLVDYFHARQVEDRAFRVLGTSQSLPAMLRRMEQWHRALARAKDLSGVTWAGVDLPDHHIEQKDPENKQLTVTWTFHQITTGKELAAEGTAQRHCVFGYKTSCVRGDCSIWSLTRTDAYGSKARRLTIELNRYGTIVQKRGLANRPPRADEEHMVAQWAAKFNLDNSRGW
jgi:hypothetical protein